MFATTWSKFLFKGGRELKKFDPWRRKQYKKARFRRAAARFDRFCEIEGSQLKQEE